MIWNWNCNKKIMKRNIWQYNNYMTHSLNVKTSLNDYSRQKTSSWETAVLDDCWEKVAYPGSATALLVPRIGDSLWHQLSTTGTLSRMDSPRHRWLFLALLLPPVHLELCSWLKGFSDTFCLQFCIISSNFVADTQSIQFHNSWHKVLHIDSVID